LCRRVCHLRSDIRNDHADYGPFAGRAVDICASIERAWKVLSLLGTILGGSSSSAIKFLARTISFLRDSIFLKAPIGVSLSLSLSLSRLFVRSFPLSRFPLSAVSKNLAGLTRLVTIN